MEENVGFRADNEEGCAEREDVEAFEIHVPAVHDVEGPGLPSLSRCASSGSPLSVTAQTFWGQPLRCWGLNMPRRRPSRSSLKASVRLKICTSSQSVFQGLGALGGVRPKSPGLRLCSGFPL